MKADMMGRCFLCLEPGKLTQEHIISQALGGRLKRSLYCERCNSTSGEKIDADLARSYGHLATLLKVKREHGSNQPYEVTDVNRGIPLLHDGQSLSRKKPIVQIIEREGKLEYADVTARSPKELEDIRRSIRDKYGILEPGRTFEERHSGPIDASYDRKPDTRQIRRAVTKIAYGLLCMRAPATSVFAEQFSRTREFIRHDGGVDLACLNLMHTAWMTDYIRPLHRIHISVNRPDRLVVGYVMIFGIYRFTVLLSNSFRSPIDWPDLDYTYDPVAQRRVVGRSEFVAPRIAEPAILRPRQSKEFVRREIITCYKILEPYVPDWKFLDLQFA